MDRSNFQTEHSKDQNNPAFLDQDDRRGIQTEMMIMSCTNGSDGYPSQIEFNRRMENYIGRKKRAERTVVSEDELLGIHALLSDPVAMRSEPDVSHRTWVKKTFMLKTFINGTFVCHKDKGQSSAQPIASKEKMYFILKQAHASEGHGGRDKTAKAVKRTHSFIRKGLICLFLEVCPTCRARNDAVKKDKLLNAAQSSTESTTSLTDTDEQAIGGSSLPPWARAQSHHLSPQRQQQSPFYFGEDGDRLANQALNMTFRRAPTHTEVGSMVPPQNLAHMRYHTYPLLEGNYNNVHLDLGESSTRSVTPQNAPIFQTFEQAPNNFSIDLHQQVLGPPPAFPVHLDDHHHHHHSSQDGQTSYCPQNENQYRIHDGALEQHGLFPVQSTNLFDSANVPFLMRSPMGDARGPQSDDTRGGGFSNFRGREASERRRELTAEEDFERLLLSADLCHPSRPAEPNTFNYLLPYEPKEPIEPSGSQNPGGSRMLIDKNHKQLSLLTPSNFSNVQRSLVESDYGTSSPSTAGSLWTTEDELSGPLLTSGFHQAMSAVSLNPTEFEEADRTVFPHQ